MVDRQLHQQPFVSSEVETGWHGISFLDFARNERGFA